MAVCSPRISQERTVRAKRFSRLRCERLQIGFGLLSVFRIYETAGDTRIDRRAVSLGFRNVPVQLTFVGFQGNNERGSGADTARRQRQNRHKTNQDSASPGHVDRRSP